jgi:hypothetical protein
VGWESGAACWERTGRSREVEKKLPVDDWMDSDENDALPDLEFD